MLLLYLSKQLGDPLNADGIYIPLCFYFIQNEYEVSHCTNWFTFHYASTLSKGWLIDCGDGTRIYIPLCFYFIRLKKSLPGYQKNLHSTMLLLYLWYGNIHIVPLLNLHSTMLLLYQMIPIIAMMFPAIYIPLCFYFIVMAIAAWSPYFSNLHSTMLLLYPSPSRLRSFSLISFTFHYASTLSSSVRNAVT